MSSAKDDLTITLTPRERLHLLCASDIQHAAQHGNMQWVEEAAAGFQVAHLTCAEQHDLAERLNPASHRAAITRLTPPEPPLDPRLN